MAENFELLETGQIEVMHQQSHDRLSEDGDNCDTVRMQHDSLAAELVRRGIAHDTEIVCPEVETNAPNYRRGFTDDVCTQCAFGQLFPFCNLYKFDYTKGYTCDSFRYFEMLELEAPHGFLMAQEKQTAIALPSALENDKARLIVSDGQVFGIAIFEPEPVQLGLKEFDTEHWFDQHRVLPRERRQWWSDNEVFYVYRVKEWHPYEGIKLYEDSKVVNEPKLTAKQWEIVSTAKELPKQITLIDNAVSITNGQEFIIETSAKCKELDSILSATYQTDVRETNEYNELIPIYSLALVRNPRMRVVKKSQDNVPASEKQEGETMPFAIRQREDEYCVVKISPDESEETMACHETEAEAEAQLTALRINVEAEEGESAVHTDKPKKRKPKKKEVEEKSGLIEGLRNIGKSIADFLKSAETEKNEVNQELLTDNYGITQKEVNGELWHFTWSTNAFMDREGEIFSTKSLENYVSQAEKKQEKGYFNLWHINAEDGNFNTDFAKKEWQGVVGRFLVEAGPYLDDKKGQSAKDFFREFGSGHSEVAPEGWGCSPEFRYLPEERKTGVYKNIWITRTSTLPRMAAANIWTETRQLARSKNMALSDDQIKAAIEVFKDEEFVKGLIAEGESKTAELEAAGIAHKEKTEENKEQSPEPQQVNIDMEELAAEVGKQFSANLDPIAEAIAAMATELKELKEWKEKQEKDKEVKSITETPRYTFNLQRASENTDTIVTDDDGLKNQRPKETGKVGSDSWSQIFNK